MPNSSRKTFFTHLFAPFLGITCTFTAAVAFLDVWFRPLSGPPQLTMGRSVLFIALIAFVWFGYRFTLCRLPALISVGDIGNLEKKPKAGAMPLALVTVILGFSVGTLFDELTTPIESFPPSHSSQTVSFYRAVAPIPLQPEPIEFASNYQTYGRTGGYVADYYFGGRIAQPKSAHVAIFSTDRLEFGKSAPEQARINLAIVSARERESRHLAEFSVNGGFVRPLSDWENALLSTSIPTWRSDMVKASGFAIVENPRKTAAMTALFASWIFVLVNFFPLIGIFRDVNPVVLQELHTIHSYLGRLFGSRYQIL